jgi:hypothetical protein
MDATGFCEFEERRFGAGGETAGTVRERFQLTD